MIQKNMKPLYDPIGAGDEEAEIGQTSSAHTKSNRYSHGSCVTSFVLSILGSLIANGQIQNLGVFKR